MNAELEQRLRFIEQTFGITVSPQRLAGWVTELEGGGGRTLDQLWGDILKNVVGLDKIKRWVADTAGEAGGNYDDARLTRIANEIMSGQVTFNDKKQQIYDAEGFNPANPALEEGAQPGEEGDAVGVGTPGENGLTILTAKEMNWYYDKATGKWYVGYGLPGSAREIVFEASPEDMDALFGKNMRPQQFTSTSAKNLFQRAGVTFGGDIAAMEGTGSFEAEVERVIAQALDEGKLPDWASGTPAVMDILYTAQALGKGPDWVLQELSKTKEFKTRFPGLDKLMKAENLSLTEAVGGFLEFEAGLRKLENQWGENPDSITPASVAALMAKGYSLSQVEDTYQMFGRMKEYKPALDAFNQVLEANGMKPLKNAQDQIAFLKGQAPAEIYDLYEASSIQESATAAGLEQWFSAKDAIEVALASQGVKSNQEIAQSMQQAAAWVLRFRGQLSTGKYGLNHEDLIDISMGMAPSSGTSEAEIREKLDAIQKEAEGFLSTQGTPFVGFSKSGRPGAASFGELTQEGL